MSKYTPLTKTYMDAYNYYSVYQSLVFEHTNSPSILGFYSVGGRGEAFPSKPTSFLSNVQFDGQKGSSKPDIDPEDTESE